MNKRPLDSSTRSQEEEGSRHHSKRHAPSMSNLQNHEINGSPRHFTLDDIRQVVREEVEQVFNSCIQNALKAIIPRFDILSNEIQKLDCKGMDHPIPPPFEQVTRTPPTDMRNLQLRFKSKLPLPVFTWRPIKSQLEGPILVELIDANTNSIVTSGPGSCARLDVVVLGGDFNKEDNDTWPAKVFEKHMVKEREKKPALLTGKLQVKLKDGIGELEDLTFTDNSRWTISGKFRIGVKTASGYCEGIRIREAVTEAFSVKEHRGEGTQKHYPPKPDDDIWRLDEIAKGGPYCKRLNDAGVEKVEDFMRILVGDPEKLQNILHGMPKKRREALEVHANTCVSDGKSYLYLDEMEDFGVVISNFCHIVGFVTGGFYSSAEKLPPDRKVTMALKITTITCGYGFDYGEYYDDED